MSHRDGTNLRRGVHERDLYLSQRSCYQIQHELRTLESIITSETQEYATGGDT
jgi:hypothetical protein